MRRTPLRIVAPGGRAAEARYAARTTGPLLAKLEEYFGIPHPYPKLDSVAIPQTVGFGAMENTGLITYVERLILLEEGRTSEDERRDYEDVAAHEMAHQWFGNLVTMVWWDDIWLNEGFASWMGDKILDQVHPDWGVALANVARRSRAIDADSLVSARQVRQPIEDEGDVYDAFDGITYAKGASLLEAFERWMGEETFRRGVQTYLRRHAYGNATSADFLAALSAAGGPEIAPAFASFLDQPGVPLVRVGLECGDGKPALRLAQERFLPLGSPGGGEQSWRIPVRVRYDAGGRSTEARILLAEKTGRLALPGAAACPGWVVANDGGTGYYVSAYEGDLLRPLLAGEVELSRPEELSVLRDARNLTRSGDLPIGELLAALPRFAASEEREVVEAAKAAAEGLDEAVPDTLRANYQRFVRRLFGARARALGFRAGARRERRPRPVAPGAPRPRGAAGRRLGAAGRGGDARPALAGRPQGGGSRGLRRGPRAGGSGRRRRPLRPLPGRRQAGARPPRAAPSARGAGLLPGAGAGRPRAGRRPVGRFRHPRDLAHLPGDRRDRRRARSSSGAGCRRTSRPCARRSRSSCAPSCRNSQANSATAGTRDEVEAFFSARRVSTARLGAQPRPGARADRPLRRAARGPGREPGAVPGEPVAEVN